MLITPYSKILEPALAAEDYIQTQIQKLVIYTSFGIGGIFLVVIVLALSFSRFVTRPLQILADGARKLAGGQLETKVAIRSRDEFGCMAKVFNSVGPRLEEHYQLRQSLDLAMEVQQNLLPKVDPQIHGLDVARKCIFCEETGGDYYDYLETGPNRFRVVVGDVSGHDAALLYDTRSDTFVKLTGDGLPLGVTIGHFALTKLAPKDYTRPLLSGNLARHLIQMGCPAPASIIIRS